MSKMVHHGPAVIVCPGLYYVVVKPDKDFPSGPCPSSSEPKAGQDLTSRRVAGVIEFRWSYLE